MNTPEAKLSAAERAALANLEAAAVADDPHLAARLKGSPVSRVKKATPIVFSYLRGRWVSILRLRWWGIPLAVLGVVLMILGLSASLVLSVFGAVMCCVGLRISAQIIEERRKKTPPAPPSSPSS